MLNRSPAVTAHYANRLGRHARLLVWIKARNKTTNAVEPVGIWTGIDDRSFTIGAETRTYIGAGSIASIAPMTFEAGLKVRTQRINLSSIAPVVEDLARDYDTRLAQCEIHVAHYNPASEALLAEPERVFKGEIDRISMPTAKLGEQADWVVELLGPARQLRRTLALKKSLEGHQSRAPDDTFLQYTDLTGSVDCYWGEIRAATPSQTDETPIEPFVSPR